MNTKKEALEALDQMQCSCTVRERDSGHRTDCDMPQLKEIVRSVLDKPWHPIETAEKSWHPILAVGFTEDGQPVPIVAHWDNGQWKEYSTKQWLTSLTHWQHLDMPPQQERKRA